MKLCCKKTIENTEMNHKFEVFNKGVEKMEKVLDVY